MAWLWDYMGLHNPNLWCWLWDQTFALKGCELSWIVFRFISTIVTICNYIIHLTSVYLYIYIYIIISACSSWFSRKTSFLEGDRSRSLSPGPQSPWIAESQAKAVALEEPSLGFLAKGTQCATNRFPNKRFKCKNTFTINLETIGLPWFTGLPYMYN